MNNIQYFFEDIETMETKKSFEAFTNQINNFVKLQLSLVDIKSKKQYLFCYKNKNQDTKSNFTILDAEGLSFLEQRLNQYIQNIQKDFFNIIGTLSLIISLIVLYLIFIFPAALDYQYDVLAIIIIICCILPIITLLNVTMTEPGVLLRGDLPDPKLQQQYD